MFLLSALACACAARGFNRDSFSEPTQGLSRGNLPNFTVKEYGQDVPPALLAEYESWFDHDYAFILSNGRRHYALSVISNLPQNHFSDLFWEFEIHYPKEIFPWPREGDGPFYRDELPRGFEGSTSISNVLTVLEYRDAQARRELNQTLAPLLDDVHTQMGRASGPLEGARLAMEHCDPIFKREAWWRAMDSGLSTAFSLLTAVYNPTGLWARGLLYGGMGAIGGLESLAQGDYAGAALNAATSLAMLKTVGAAAKVADKANDARTVAKSTTMCFVAGTQVVVQADDGSQTAKNIEDVEVGDRVLSRDDRTGNQGFKPVLNTFVTHPGQLLHLSYKREGGSSDDPDELVGTAQHPFWSVTRGDWVEMGSLEIGERLLLADGSAATVTGAWTETAAESSDPQVRERSHFTTYNFEVADWHTYFVRPHASSSTPAVWVHNTGRLCEDALNRAADAYKRKPGLIGKMDLHPDDLAEIQRRSSTAPQKTFQTYTKTNETTGQVYSGRTSGTGTPEENIAARDAGHHMNEKGFGPAQLDKSSVIPAPIRGREQQLIIANGGAQSMGGTSGNAINGISPKNPKLQSYFDAANAEFGK